MKVLHIAETIRGGIATHLNALIPGLQTHAGEDNIRCLVPDAHAADLDAVPASAIRTFRRPSRLGGLAPLVVASVREIRDWKPDVVHLHSSFAGALIRPIAALTRARVVYTPHCWSMARETDPLKIRAYGTIERLLSLLTDRIVAGSTDEAVVGERAGIASSRIALIFNGLPATPPAFAPGERTDTRLKLLFIGRLDRQKGVDILLKAIRPLQDRVSLEIAGDAVVADSSVSFEGLTNVTRLGWISPAEVSRRLSVCDAAVLPSRWEGLCYVPMEAMRVSKPVLAARVGGLKDLVLDGQTGFFFEPESPEALQTLLEGLAPGDALAAMGEAGHRYFMDTFTAEKMTGATWALYRDLVGGAVQLPRNQPRKEG
ncbi:glycosyltransferase [Phaeovibrio sulfidiphilus]|uniref:Glycosyltransferase n=1 Tax=Phaeovibrio sulfidiphilus TaxID=1220600 RepID=A0A8J6YYG9_9PROT|nr:glycosyltransferase [Phaeovibrio sulfidiphilus]MBE1236863.1 glycosyltransferase [Phaeovibrio sulfidiphilus]